MSVAVDDTRDSCANQLRISKVRPIVATGNANKHTFHIITNCRTLAPITAKMARHAQLRLTKLSHGREAGLDVSQVDIGRALTG